MKQSWLTKESIKLNLQQEAITSNVSSVLHLDTASQCPNKKVMIVPESVEEVVSKDESNLIIEEEKEQVVDLVKGESLLLFSAI